MRISPNQPRLRIVAIACWGLGAFCLIHGGSFSLGMAAMVMLTISTKLLGFFLLAIGVAFWLLSADRRAGIIFDKKGLLLNLGSFSSFIAWENIERVGVSSYRSSLLSIGSTRQFGIALKNTSGYIQSYEERMPASSSIAARGIRWLNAVLQPFRQQNDEPIRHVLERNRSQTGFDVLIPEAFLGGRADTFADLVESYRSQALFQRVGV